MMKIEYRINELEKELNNEINQVLQKETKPKFPRLHEFWRGMRGFHKPQAYDYTSFAGLIAPTDQSLIEKMKGEPLGQNAWLREKHPRFFFYLHDDYVTTQLLGDLLKIVGGTPDPRESYALVPFGTDHPYRVGPVEVLGSGLILPPHEEIPYLIQRLNNHKEEREKGSPLEQAAEIHYNFINIHPFYDGNGRVARLLMNKTLIRENYPALDIISEDEELYKNSLKVSQLTREPKYFADFITLKTMKMLGQ